MPLREGQHPDGKVKVTGALHQQTVSKPTADRDAGWTRKVDPRKDKWESLCEVLEEVNYLPLDEWPAVS